MGKWLIAAGALLLALGLALHFAPGLFGWFGRLPGDIRIEGPRGRFYFPITSLLLVSVVLNLLVHVLRR
ncbi:MAG: DUF2905 domain-containing protein [Gammaproteobacteria bacterium]|nr:DUF2905 domain-containing protein [Gammaproteobacteria bacterium]MCP5199113.1 DUF2905 domain-containing protein [Gammaproteobacteria bacterium]